jgi:hypothetical protein
MVKKSNIWMKFLSESHREGEKAENLGSAEPKNT